MSGSHFKPPPLVVVDDFDESAEIIVSSSIIGQEKIDNRLYLYLKIIIQLQFQ